MEEPAPEEEMSMVPPVRVERIDGRQSVVSRMGRPGMH